MIFKYIKTLAYKQVKSNKIIKNLHLPNSKRVKDITKFENYIIQKVKKRRQELKISQKNLAFMLDFSIGFIGKIESPKYSTKWKLDHLNELAKVLKCSPKDFLPEKPL